MMLSAQKKFHSFDGTETIEARYREPDRYRDFLNLPKGETFIVQGGGYSYVPAGLSTSAHVIRNKHFNRILTFDKTSKQVTVEAGITLGRLQKFLHPHNLTLAVLPGYPEITVGGCVAANIHGKNQFRDGIFSDIVDRVKLFHPKHGMLDLSRSGNAEVFDITCGGYGLTGIIVEVTLNLSPVKGSCVRLRKVRVTSNEDLLHKIREAAEESDMIYTWQNFTSEKNFGSGFLYLGSYANDYNEIKKRTTYKILDAELRSKNSLRFFNYPFTKIFNAAYQWKQTVAEDEADLSLFEFSFPVVNKMVYFKLFGKQGFYEYQTIIPFDRFLPFCEQLENLFLKMKAPVTLASCKYFRGQQKFLHFTSDGICLAVDMPASLIARKIMAEIDALVISHSCLPNISKDSRLSAKVTAQTYLEYDAFRKALRGFDPDALFQSSLRKRLEL